MLIFDAFVAGLIFKMFGENGLLVLAITCGVTFLRLSGHLNAFIKAMENGIAEMMIEVEKKEEE